MMAILYFISIIKKHQYQPSTNDYNKLKYILDRILSERASADCNTVEKVAKVNS